jgi:hypothetical protein
LEFHDNARAGRKIQPSGGRPKSAAGPELPSRRTCHSSTTAGAGVLRVRKRVTNNSTSPPAVAESGEDGKALGAGCPRSKMDSTSAPENAHPRLEVVVAFDVGAKYTKIGYLSDFCVRTPQYNTSSTGAVWPIQIENVSFGGIDSRRDSLAGGSPNDAFSTGDLACPSQFCRHC